MPIKKKNLYVTYVEAQSAVRALGILYRSDCKAPFRTGTRLPPLPFYGYARNGDPNCTDDVDIPKFRDGEAPRFVPTPNGVCGYAGWMSWYDFLSKLKPRNRNDPRLPSKPYRKYDDDA